METFIHFRISPVFTGIIQDFAYVPCQKMVWEEAYISQISPEQREFMRSGYSARYVGDITRYVHEVTCPECKKTWEYIEASINEQ